MYVLGNDDYRHKHIDTLALNGAHWVYIFFYFNLNRKLIGEAYGWGFYLLSGHYWLFAQGNVRHIRILFCCVVYFSHTLYWIAHRPWQIIHDDVIDMLWIKLTFFGTAAFIRSITELQYFMLTLPLLLNFPQLLNSLTFYCLRESEIHTYVITM